MIDAPGCCGSAPLDQTRPVEDRYGAVAQELETCLCKTVGFDAELLRLSLRRWLSGDYGCGVPPAGFAAVTGL